MKTLINKTISVRALEPEDLEFLYQVENNESFWEVSSTKTPFSRYILKQYLENAHLDLYEAKQLRLVIEENSTQLKVGMIDLYDYNPQHKRAGVGILIHPDFQEKGYATEALSVLIKYVFTYLDVHQLFANITVDNAKSVSLFKKHNFIKVGVKKDWILSKGHFKDEILFQLLKK
jgi:diamine N-acetyltransferase